MAVINIRKAKREGARLIIGIAGISGMGKTRTALEIAFGLANFDASKIGFLDTENKRGSLYADVLKNDKGEVQEFLIGDLEPPFSPARYAESIKEFQKHGIEVLVIDSVSHEHEGTGGLLEMSEPLPGTKAPRHNLAKAEHKKFMNVLLQSNMHVITCVRAREKVKVENQGGKVVYLPQGVQPICEKNFLFEMTASIMMWDAGRTQAVIKCHEELLQILGRGQGYITPADGKRLRDWVLGGAQVDADMTKAKSDLLMTCERGMDALVDAWKALPAAMRKAISADGKCPDEYKRSAEEYDRLRTASADPAIDDLNDAILGEIADNG